jgi:hypothetical protein
MQRTRQRGVLIDAAHACVSEVGLPAFGSVGRRRSQCRRTKDVWRCRCRHSGVGEVAADRGDRYLQVVVGAR